MDEDRQYSAHERLADINSAIQAVLLGGQSYRIGTHNLTRADLALLRSMRDDLEAQLATEDNPRLFARTYVAHFDSR